MKRSLRAFGRTTARTVELDAVELLAFHGCGYLGLAHDPRVVEAAQRAAEVQGTSGLASRGTSGNLELHERLEARLADFLRVESALVLPDGFLANLAAVEALVRRGHEVALLDADCHASLVHAARLSGAQRYDYGAGDVNRAIALLGRHAASRPMVLTDGAFGMHGRLAPVPELLRHLPEGGMVVLDDCHGIGVLGDGGRGTLEAFGAGGSEVLVTGSLGKAFGAAGGFVAGPTEAIESIRRNAEAFITTTALAPPAAAAALAAIDVIDAEPARLERLRANTGQLHRTARRLGVPSSGTFLPILRLPFEAMDAAVRVSAGLHVEGIFAPAMQYPGVPSGGVLRLAVTSEHTAHDLRRLEECLERHLPADRGSP